MEENHFPMERILLFTIFRRLICAIFKCLYKILYIINYSLLLVNLASPSCIRHGRVIYLLLIKSWNLFYMNPCSFGLARRCWRVIDSDLFGFGWFAGYGMWLGGCLLFSAVNDAGRLYLLTANPFMHSAFTCHIFKLMCLLSLE